MASALPTAAISWRDTEGPERSDPRADGNQIPVQFRYTLAAGEAFFAPQVLMSYSSEGFTGLTHQYHDLIREHICRGAYKHAKRPVLINNWEATYFDFDKEKIVKIAQQAHELGIEMLVLDDGWFGKRAQRQQRSWRLVYE